MLLAAVFAMALQGKSAELPRGDWPAWLDSRGGKIAFGLEVRGDPGLYCFLRSRDERLRFDESVFADGTLRLAMSHYDSTIVASMSTDGRRLDGEWRKRSGSERWTSLPFHAALDGDRQDGNCTMPGPTNLAQPIIGRWSVRFAADEEPSVGIFNGLPESITGNFLTTTGDYRYLEGSFDIALRRLSLACFDGAHAFLFKAELRPDGSLQGDFWSGDAWHDTWTAVRDENARLADPFGLTKWNENASLASNAFRDVDGRPRALADFPGKARMLVLFGSWCPNCNDEAAYLRELDERYRQRGLSIVGLAFEHTGELERDARQVKLFAERHKLTFPLLIAGTSDKAEASKRFPLLDRVRAYPTTVFLHADGRARAVHQGYSGPATGAEHTKLREDFERLIEELLAEHEAKK